MLAILAAEAIAQITRRFYSKQVLKGKIVAPQKEIVLGIEGPALYSGRNGRILAILLFLSIQAVLISLDYSTGVVSENVSTKEKRWVAGPLLRKDIEFQDIDSLGVIETAKRLVPLCGTVARQRGDIGVVDTVVFEGHDAQKNASFGGKRIPSRTCIWE